MKHIYKIHNDVLFSEEARATFLMWCNVVTQKPQRDLSGVPVSQKMQPARVLFKKGPIFKVVTNPYDTQKENSTRVAWKSMQVPKF